MTLFAQNHTVVSAAPYLSTPIGYQQLAMTASALSLTVPANAQWVIITVEGSAADTVRWRDDGTPPTSAIGMPISLTGASPPASTPFAYTGDLTMIQFIGASTSKVNVSYYR